MFFVIKKLYLQGFTVSIYTKLPKVVLSLVTNGLILLTNCGCVSLLVLLDLSAAFDTINQNILLNRFKKMMLPLVKLRDMV